MERYYNQLIDYNEWIHWYTHFDRLLPQVSYITQNPHSVNKCLRLEFEPTTSASMLDTIPLTMCSHYNLTISLDQWWFTSHPPHFKFLLMHGLLRVSVIFDRPLLLCRGCFIIIWMKWSPQNHRWLFWWSIFLLLPHVYPSCNIPYRHAPTYRVTQWS